MLAQRTQAAVPYLYYENGPEALDYLIRVFGFEERQRQVRPDGTIGHAEVLHDGDVIMLSTPEAATAGLAGAERDSMYCYVQDARSHCDKVRAAGAKIVFGPRDRGYGLFYCVEDSERRKWYFAERED
ncbi:MAG: VOC family protein [Solirubrobacteraceae bacterium]